MKNNNVIGPNIDLAFNSCCRIDISMPSPSDMDIDIDGGDAAMYDMDVDITINPLAPFSGPDYNNLRNKPSINGVTLESNKTSEEIGVIGLPSNSSDGDHLIYVGDRWVSLHIEPKSQIWWTYDEIVPGGAIKRSKLHSKNGLTPTDGDYVFGPAIGKYGGGSPTELYSITRAAATCFLEWICSFESELPAVSSEDSGKVLAVDDSGAWQAHLLTPSEIGAYVKPSWGIPKNDLHSSIQFNLEKIENIAIFVMDDNDQVFDYNSSDKTPINGADILDYLGYCKAAFLWREETHELYSTVGATPYGDITFSCVLAPGTDPSDYSLGQEVVIVPSNSSYATTQTFHFVSGKQSTEDIGKFLKVGAFGWVAPESVSIPSSAADIGAIAVPTNALDGNVLTYSSGEWIGRTAEFIVNISYENNIYSANKTFSAITQAATQGQVVVAIYGGAIYYHTGTMDNSATYRNFVRITTNTDKNKIADVFSIRNTNAVTREKYTLGSYSLPSTGIPKTDLEISIQSSLDKADTALQSAPVISVNGQTGVVNCGNVQLWRSDKTYVTKNTSSGYSYFTRTFNMYGVTGDPAVDDFVIGPENGADTSNENLYIIYEITEANIVKLSKICSLIHGNSAYFTFSVDDTDDDLPITPGTGVIATDIMCTFASGIPVFAVITFENSPGTLILPLTLCDPDSGDNQLEFSGGLNGSNSEWVIRYTENNGWTCTTLLIPSTASQIGAIPAPSSPSNDDLLQWNGNTWAAASISIPSQASDIGAYSKPSNGIPASDLADDVNLVPSGGTTGQVLKKFSNNDWDADWADDFEGTIFDFIWDADNEVMVDFPTLDEVQAAGPGAVARFKVFGVSDEMYIPLADNIGTFFGVLSDGAAYSIYYANDTWWYEELPIGGGTSDYADLTNKPQINSVTLDGNKTASELGLSPEMFVVTVTGTSPNFTADKTYAEITAAVAANHPMKLVKGDDVYEYAGLNDHTHYFIRSYIGGNSRASISSTNEVTTGQLSYGTYSKPSGGIPATDLAAAVQSSLDKADTALQPGDVSEPFFVTYSTSNGTTWSCDKTYAQIVAALSAEKDISVSVMVGANRVAQTCEVALQTDGGTHIELWVRASRITWNVAKHYSDETISVTNDGLTYVDVDAVAADQGSANAGKVLKVGNNGVVIPEIPVEPYFVTYSTSNMTNWTCDKTYTQIVTAAMSGLPVICSVVVAGNPELQISSVEVGSSMELIFRQYVGRGNSFRIEHDSTDFIVSHTQSVIPSDIGAVAVAQGVDHAGEFLVVGSDGNVTTMSLSTWQGGTYGS